MKSFDNKVNKGDSIDVVDKWVLYKSGWRPALGWVSVAIIILAFIIHPSVAIFAAFKYPAVIIPAVNTEALLSLVGIILGVGAMRTYEKVKYNELQTKGDL